MAGGGSLASAARWDEWLLDADAEALRYRISSSRLLLRRSQCDALHQRVQVCLDAEVRALEALEAEALRQHQQQLHALKYGQYLSILSAHLEAASGGSVGMVKLAHDDRDVLQALMELGLPSDAPLQVLHAYGLRNERIQDDFAKRLHGGQKTRLLALHLPTSAVEHTLVHGLRPKPLAGEEEVEWHVDPRTVPEASCVDISSLASLVRSSAPAAAPFAFFAGRAGWEALLAGAVAEASTARKALQPREGNGMRDADGGHLGMAAAGGASAGGASSTGGGAPDSAAVTKGQQQQQQQQGAASGTGSSSSVPKNKLLLLVRVALPPADPSDASAATAAMGSASRLEFADPASIRPVFLLHYGTMTRPFASSATSSSSSGGDKHHHHHHHHHVSHAADARANEPRGGRGDSKGGGGGGGKAASGRGEGAKGKAAAAAASARIDDAESGGALPPELRATREFSEYLSCKASGAERMREVAAYFATAIEGIGAQLMPARAATLTMEMRREAELNALISDAKSELTRIKKANRDLASELQTTY